jgi:hypothetical protein
MATKVMLEFEKISEGLIRYNLVYIPPRRNPETGELIEKEFLTNRLRTWKSTEIDKEKRDALDKLRLSYNELDWIMVKLERMLRISNIEFEENIRYEYHEFKIYTGCDKNEIEKNLEFPKINYNLDYEIQGFKNDEDLYNFIKENHIEDTDIIGIWREGFDYFNNKHEDNSNANTRILLWKFGYRMGDNPYPHQPFKY